MGFDPWNCPLNIRESIETPTPKMRVHLRVWGFIPSHFLAFPGAWNVTPRLPFWPVTLQVLALVTSLRLGLRHKMYTPQQLVNSFNPPYPQLLLYLQKILYAKYFWNSKALILHIYSNSCNRIIVPNILTIRQFLNQYIK
jgi:hypothetical protein